MTTPEDCAYLAGIIDGEGHIGAYLRSSKLSARLQVEMKLNIANTDRSLVVWIVERWGGRLKLVSRTALHPTWRDIYRIDFESQRAIAPLEAALPFLIVKRERADMALELARLATREHGRRGYPPELRDRREFLARAITEANRTGPR